MSMKQKIMEKLFAEKPLTNEEILLIGASLDDTTSPDETKKASLPTFNHSEKNLPKACGLTQEDFETVNKLIRSEIMGRKDELDCNSKAIEVYERIGLAKPANFRLLMYQFVKMKGALQKTGGITMRMGGIGKGGGGDFGDFLDFLKGRGEDI